MTNKRTRRMFKQDMLQIAKEEAEHDSEYEDYIRWLYSQMTEDERIEMLDISSNSKEDESE